VLRSGGTGLEGEEKEVEELKGFGEADSSSSSSIVGIDEVVFVEE